MVIEVALHQLSLLGGMDRAHGASIVSTPAEQRITGVGLLELSMNQAELAQGAASRSVGSRLSTTCSIGSGAVVGASLQDRLGTEQLLDQH